MEITLLSKFSAIALSSKLNLIAALGRRARYSLSLGGSYPKLLVLDDKNSPLSIEDLRLENFVKTKKQWRLCLPKAYHPLLLQRHRHNLREAKKDVAN